MKTTYKFIEYIRVELKNKIAKVEKEIQESKLIVPSEIGGS